MTKQIHDEEETVSTHGLHRVVTKCSCGEHFTVYGLAIGEVTYTAYQMLRDHRAKAEQLK